eukprot:CAMPEP_0185910134 /NCGR_PEP_ID=MMETSP0196C-20130402/17596_1 /TAXON_ID=2932 /ORGANISM="Alexandrium fundyense, Strain CCMP1719" /LENGTH=36 /DNA_ID= /DNA_START= /DNA_END= /DNA_ORIENTATION=
MTTTPTESTSGNASPWRELVGSADVLGSLNCFCVVI